MNLQELIKTEIKIDNGVLTLKNKNLERKYPLRKLSNRLAKAAENELSDFIISPSHYGIHWNKIDEDISVAALLKEPEAVYKKRIKG